MSTPRAAPTAGDALVIIDVQSDFLPGGALAVPDGNAVVEPLNRWLARFVSAGLPVFATRDWHPPDHCSFVSQGGPWPAHCVMDTPGAEFAAELRLPAGVRVVSKGSDAAREAYSDFAAGGFEAELQRQGLRRLFVGGLATEYCVLSTVRDALARGYRVALLVDAIRPIDLRPGDGQRAVDEMVRLGAVPVTCQGATVP